MNLQLNTEVKYLKGVGPQRAAMLESRRIITIEDLLLNLPFRYEDRTRFVSIRELRAGETFTVRAKVVGGGVMKFGKSYWANRDAIYNLAVEDASGMLHCRFFHGSYLEGRLKPGQMVVVHGKVDYDPARPVRLEMVNPELEVLGAEGADSTEVGRIVPIYEAMEGISSRMLRRIVYGALQGLEPKFPDPLPQRLRDRLGLPEKWQAITAVHFPSAGQNLEELNTFRSPAHRRLIFEEFFYFQLGLALRQRNAKQEPGIAFRVRDDRVREAIKKILPFKPTGAQKRVLAEIVADMERSWPMNRLLQGDVGSGKTIVALEAATIAIENGFQVAMMAPTEILAVQHFLNAKRVFAKAGYRTQLVISGLTSSEKRRALERVETGEAHFIIGTHALIEDRVKFRRLGLIIVDEQHRFGVMQRKRLIEKGATHAKDDPKQPDVLVMTATPIPRTLSLTLYGDLDISVLDELPPGRTAVETQWRSDDQLSGVWNFLRQEVGHGRQAYIVYPVIEESKLELKAATAEHERLSKVVFPGLRVELLHGRMKSEEKEGIMEKFRRGVIQILVSTTVIEVGVDVPNATVMVVEHAERFGLAQLHQLRGRIGRGSNRSHCILIASKNPTEEARQRLETLVSSTNGFEIAEVDLKLRGPGEFFGTRQHGILGFHVAHPVRDHELLQLARDEAFSLVAQPESVAQSELQQLSKYLDPNWQRRYSLAAVG